MPDSFPVVTSSCIILEFAAIHIGNVTFSSLTSALFALIMMRAPPVSPISCSSSGLANVLTLTRFGIERGFPPLLLAAALDVAGMVLLVAPSASKGSSNALIPSIFSRIPSSPPSFTRDLAVTGVKSAPSSFKVVAPGPGPNRFG